MTTEEQMTKETQEEKEDKELYSYCIPSPLAKLMDKVDDRTQMEASLMSMFLLLMGLILFTTYVLFFSGWNWWMRTMTSFNGICGFIFLFSYLVTTFQQYQALRETQNIVGQFGTEDPFPDVASTEEPFPTQEEIQTDNSLSKINKKEV